MTTLTDILDLDATYHRPGAARLAADLGATLAPDPVPPVDVAEQVAGLPADVAREVFGTPPTLGTLDGPAMEAAHRCCDDETIDGMRCGPSDDDCDSNGTA
jgi:hypothetical protein